MGTIYSVTCKKCKVTRDLDKFVSTATINDRREALEFSEYLENKKVLFREGLLISFLNEHKGHECVLFNEEDEAFDQYYDNGYEEDIDFFKET